MHGLDWLMIRNLEVLFDKVNDLVERRRATGLYSAKELTEYRHELFVIFGLDERPDQEQG